MSKWADMFAPASGTALVVGEYSESRRQTPTTTALQKQLDEAKQQVQDIAVKAIEGASGARALSHVNQIAMEQAKTRGGQA